MIRLSRALVRSRGLSESEFGPKHEHFMEDFAAYPLVRRYVRSFVAANASGAHLPGQPPRRYDGLLDLWFDDAAALREYLNDPSYTATIGAKERELIDPAASNDLVTADLPAIFDGGMRASGFYRSDKIRFSALLIRNPKLSFEAFAEHHRAKHVPLFVSIPIVKQKISRYVVAHRVPVDGLRRPAKAYDGIVEFFFDDVIAMTAVFVDLGYLSRARPDEERFLDLIATDIFIGREFSVG